jgi:hypothetical protein
MGMTLGVALEMKVIITMNHSSNPRTLPGTCHFPQSHRQRIRIRASEVDKW